MYQPESPYYLMTTITQSAWPPQVLTAGYEDPALRMSWFGVIFQVIIHWLVSMVTPQGKESPHGGISHRHVNKVINYFLKDLNNPEASKVVCHRQQV